MSIDDFDDDKPTPADTPQARRSSKSLEKAQTCPRCKGKPIPCGVCLKPDGTNERYTHEHGVMAQWILKAAKCDTDPAPPTDPIPTPRNDR